MTRQVHFNDFEEFARIAGRGFGEWGPPMTIDAGTAEAFTRVTGAATVGGELPGCLLQSLVPRLVRFDDWQVCGHSGAVNLGSPSIRYPEPAHVGAPLRGRGRMASATPHPKGTLVALDFEVEEQGAAAPSLQSRAEVLYLGNRA